MFYRDFHSIVVKAWLASALLVVLSMMAAGCDSPAKRTACVPSCESATCGNDDGCGNTCGCTESQKCSEGQCVALDCPVCAANETCVGGTCVCTPACDGRACQDDGCGGTCACPDGHVLDGNGKPVPPSECDDTCKTAGHVCGSVCGEACGSCPGGASCEQGQCECVPKCDGTSCSDGCGGVCDCTGSNVCDAQDRCVSPSECNDTCEANARTCGTLCGKACGECGGLAACVTGSCREALNCENCSLKFSVINKVVEGGRIKRAVLALDYEPVEGEPPPRLADFRLDASRKVELELVEEGPSLVEAGKRLFFDETTQKNWQRRPDGSYQLFAYGVSDVDALMPGRIATLTFNLDENGPVGFWLTRRLEMFAPPSADQALQSTAYDRAVMVSR